MQRKIEQRKNRVRFVIHKVVPLFFFLIFILSGLQTTALAPPTKGSESLNLNTFKKNAQKDDFKSQSFSHVCMEISNRIGVLKFICGESSFHLPRNKEKIQVHEDLSNTEPEDTTESIADDQAFLYSVILAAFIILVVFWMVKKHLRNRADTRSTETQNGHLMKVAALLLPEDWHGELVALRCQLRDEEYSTQEIRIASMKFFLEILLAIVHIKIENFWLPQENQKMGNQLNSTIFKGHSISQNSSKKSTQIDIDSRGN